MTVTEKTLGDFFDLQRGTTYKSRLLGLPGPILLGLSTIQRHGGFRRDSIQTYGGEFQDKLLVRPGEIYVSLKDVTHSAELLGAVARLPNDQPEGRLTQDTVKLVPKGDRSPTGFIYWLLRTPDYREYCFERATGTTTLGLDRQDFLSFPVPAPSKEQLKLVQLFDAIEEKVDLNRRMNRTLEALAQRLFKSWFVDFDPVVAKSEGRKPFGISDEISALFPDAFEESALGLIPQGWRCGTLGDVARLRRDAVSPSSVDPALPYFGLEHFERKHLMISDWGKAGDAGSGKLRCSEGELLFGKLRPYFHKVALAPQSGVCSTDVMVIIPTAPEWRGFVVGHVFSEDFIDHADACSGGTRMPRVEWRDVANYKVPLPPQHVAARFDSVAGELVSRMKANVRQMQTLAALRDLLLPKLLSGELRIPAAEKAVKTAIWAHSVAV